MRDLSGSSLPSVKPTSPLYSHEWTLWLCYFLYLLVVPAIIGLGVNAMANRQYLRQLTQTKAKHDTIDDLCISHHQWLIRTFVIVMVLAMMSIGTIYYGVGYLLAVAAVLVWFYRVIKGMALLASHHAMPGSVTNR